MSTGKSGITEAQVTDITQNHDARYSHDCAKSTYLPSQRMYSFASYFGLFVLPVDLKHAPTEQVLDTLSPRSVHRIPRALPKAERT